MSLLMYTLCTYTPTKRPKKRPKRDLQTYTRVCTYAKNPELNPIYVHTDVAAKP